MLLCPADGWAMVLEPGGNWGMVPEDVDPSGRLFDQGEGNYDVDARGRPVADGRTPVFSPSPGAPTPYGQVPARTVKTHQRKQAYFAAKLVGAFCVAFLLTVAGVLGAWVVASKVFSSPGPSTVQIVPKEAPPATVAGVVVEPARGDVGMAEPAPAEPAPAELAPEEPVEPSQSAASSSPPGPSSPAPPKKTSAATSGPSTAKAAPSPSPSRLRSSPGPTPPPPAARSAWDPTQDPEVFRAAPVAVASAAEPPPEPGVRVFGSKESPDGAVDVEVPSTAGASVSRGGTRSAPAPAPVPPSATATATALSGLYTGKAMGQSISIHLDFRAGGEIKAVVKIRDGAQTVSSVADGTYSVAPDGSATIALMESGSSDPAIYSGTVRPGVAEGRVTVGGRSRGRFRVER